MAFSVLLEQLLLPRVAYLYSQCSADTSQLAFTLQCLCKINLHSISCPAVLSAVAKTAEV